MTLLEKVGQAIAFEEMRNRCAAAGWICSEARHDAHGSWFSGLICPELPAVFVYQDCGDVVLVRTARETREPYIV